MIRVLRNGSALVLLAFATPSSGQNGGAVPQRTTLDGVFSAAQVQRGTAVFSATCSQCHTHRRNWQGRTFYDVFDQIRSTMPNDNPGGLARRDYIDVLSWILAENGYPAGSADITSDASMKAVKIVPPTTGTMAPELHTRTHARR
jgi:mono/diheme cytochrome c family protein